MASAPLSRASRPVAIGITILTFFLLIPAMSLGFVAFINVCLVFGLAWYGWLNTPDGAALENQSSARGTERRLRQPPPADRLTAAPDPLHAVDYDIQRATRLVDSDDAVTALHRFRRTLNNLLDRDFRDDIASELDFVVQRNFPDLVRRYVAARQRGNASDAGDADRILSESVRRLTGKLNEIASMQDRIEADLLREHGDYLRQRHPVDTDPFSSIGGSR